MHASVMHWVASVARRLPVKDSQILEVGSYNVNGSVRPIFEKLGCKSYLGTDMRPGLGVDVVYDITQGPVPYPLTVVGIKGPYLAKFDLVVCCEVLEHVQSWRDGIQTLLEHVRPSGHLILTTRSKGFPLHDHPADHWRFELEDMRRIFEGRAIIHELVSDPFPEHPGVFLHAQLPVALEDIDVYKMVP